MKIGLTVRNLVIGGFSAIAFLLIVVGGIAYFALNQASNGFTAYREMARDSNLSSEVQANMLMVSMNAKNFLISHSETDLAKFDESYALTKRFLDVAAREIQKPERAAKVQDAIQHLAEYQTGFERVTQYMQQRNDLVNNGINAIGPTIRKKLSSIMSSAYDDDDVTAAFYAGIANKHLLLGRLYVVKFLETNQQSEVERAHQELEKVMESLETLEPELQNTTRRELLAEVMTGVEQYQQKFTQIVAVIQARNAIITGTLDRIGPMVAADLQDVKVDIQGVQDTLGPALVASNARSTTQVLVVASIATVFGLVLGFLTITFITRRLKEVIFGLTEAASEVTGASTQLTEASQNLATGSAEQAASIETTSASLEQMSAMTKSNAESAQKADTIMTKTQDIVSDADAAMSELVNSMEDISHSSEETSGIIKTIDEIAFQTNILALNAAVEAARAGDAGQGFAVVAEEVRSLAMRTATAAKDTSQLIEGNLVKIRNGSEVLNQTNKKFGGITDSTQRIGSLISSISQASGEQANGISEISKAITEMEGVTHSSAASAEETSASAHSLRGQSSKLDEYVERLASLV